MVRPRGLGGEVPSDISPRRLRGALNGGGHARRAPASRGWRPCGMVTRRSGRQHRHRRSAAQSSRAGPPRSFKDSLRAWRRRSISAASRGTTSRCGLSSTTPSRSTSVKGSPSPRRYFSRRDAGRVRVPALAPGSPSWPPHRKSAYQDDSELASPATKVTRQGESRGNIVSPVVDPACRSSRAFRVDELRTADRKSAGTSGVLEVPAVVGGPSRTRTLDPLIKSHFAQGSIGHHHAESGAITRLPAFWRLPMVAVA